MANVFAPFGFASAGRMDGAAWSANQREYLIAFDNTHKLYQGDPCTLLSSGYIDILAPGTTPPLGIFNGCDYISASMAQLNFSKQFPGGDQITNGVINARVLDDPNLVFLVQTGYSSSGSGPATQAMVGMNAQYAYGTPLGGISGAYIDLTTTPATTPTLPFRILSLVKDPPGANGTDTTTQYNYVLVMWNNEFYRQLTGV